MKFSDHLQTCMTPEWRKQYITYWVSKYLVSPVGCWSLMLANKEVFFQMCSKELVKVNHFYSGEKTTSQLEGHFEYSSHRLLWATLRRHSTADDEQQTKRGLSLAVREFYYSLIFDTRGFNILYDHVQLVQWDAYSLSQTQLRETKQHSAKQYRALENNTEEYKTIQKRKKLYKTLFLQPVPVWTTFRLGVTCGLLLALLALIVQEWEPLRPLLRLYRGGFLLIEFLFLLGLNVYGWKKAGVNYVLIFELDRRDNLSHYHFFEAAGGLAVCWCTSILACLYAPLLPVPLQLQPLLFYCLPLVLLLSPMPTLHARARRWLLSVLYKVLTTPFHSVGFPDFWLADQLNSLAPLFLDLWSLIWFYACEVDWKDLAPRSGSSGCLIQCFPPWLRFAQCLRNFWDSGNTKPHLLNAGKYSVVFLTITFAGLYSMALEGLTLYLYLWAASACCSVLVAITWDLRIDWGLLQGPDYLREEAVYSKRAYYYCAILADVLLRLAWGVNIILVQMRDAGSATATGILAPLEVIRRFIWNFLRLEKEHLTNCSLFRAVRDIPVRPPTQNGHSFLEKIVEQENNGKTCQKPHSAKTKSNSSFKWTRTAATERKLSMECTESELNLT
uniref:EXS domain-containing protein n=1 Tax=Paramormyrops kingsleyae TaxID=1676925 RepID=A0A3B3S3G2_9TELE